MSPPATGRPRRARPPAGPLAACVALGVFAVAQLALPSRTALPDDGFTPQRQTREAQPRPVVVEARLGSSTIFAPSRAAGVAASGDGGGLSLAGVVAGRGVATALIRTSEGRTVALRRGQSVEGWRLAALSGNGVVLTRGGERKALAVTASAAAPSTSTTANSDDTDDAEDDE